MWDALGVGLKAAMAQVKEQWAQALQRDGALLCYASQREPRGREGFALFSIGDCELTEMASGNGTK